MTAHKRSRIVIKKPRYPRDDIGNKKSRYTKNSELSPLLPLQAYEVNAPDKEHKVNEITGTDDYGECS